MGQSQCNVKNELLLHIVHERYTITPINYLHVCLYTQHSKKGSNSVVTYLQLQLKLPLQAVFSILGKYKYL